MKPGYKVLFNRDNTWRGCLGFNPQELDKASNASDRIADILPIQNIYVACNLCNGSVVGRDTLRNEQILYSFPNAKRFGVPIVERPSVLSERELGVKSFNEVSFQFFSDDNEPIDFMGHQVTMELRITQV